MHPLSRIFYKPPQSFFLPLSYRKSDFIHDLATDLFFKTPLLSRQSAGEAGDQKPKAGKTAS
jgi:hypothetical protein